jgi:hypothetical protein
VNTLYNRLWRACVVTWTVQGHENTHTHTHTHTERQGNVFLGDRVSTCPWSMPTHSGHHFLGISYFINITRTLNYKQSATVSLINKAVCLHSEQDICRNIFLSCLSVTHSRCSFLSRPTIQEAAVSGQRAATDVMPTDTATLFLSPCVTKQVNVRALEGTWVSDKNTFWKRL